MATRSPGSGGGSCPQSAALWGTPRRPESEPRPAQRWGRRRTERDESSGPVSSKRSDTRPPSRTRVLHLRNGRGPQATKPHSCAVASCVPGLREGRRREVKAKIRELQDPDLSAFLARPPSQSQGLSQEGCSLAPRTPRCLKTSSLHRSAFPSCPTPSELRATTPAHPASVALLIFALTRRRCGNPEGLFHLVIHSGNIIYLVSAILRRQLFSRLSRSQPVKK